MKITTSRQGRIAVVTLDNPPVNALSQAVRQGLIDAAEACDADASVDAVVLACAGRTFIAGADVSEFDAPPQPPHLPDVLNRIERAAKPWVAAIHGSALGGGLETALACAARVASPDASLGLPEVTLGLVPGAGGTNRTPRLVGPQAAVALATGGKPVGAKAALAMGLVDALAEGDLVAAALAQAHAVAQSGARPTPASARQAAPAPEGFWEEARAALAKSAPGQRAPLAVLDCVRLACESDFATAAAHERAMFLELRAAPQAKALRHVFFAERAAGKPPELSGVAPLSIARIAVVGGGTMGSGIAAACLEAGYEVDLIEQDEQAAARGRARVEAIVEGAVKRGKLDAAAAAARLARLHPSVGDHAFATADLVIEAVFEDMQVKRAVFARAAAAARPGTILATNTSYLDPNAIFAEVEDQAHCVGLHFFSPAHVMKLVEIVPCERTSPETLATAFEIARRLKKIPARAGVCDGFIGNRILKTMRKQAERLLLAGATPSQIDAALRAYGLPMGPFEAQDLGGLDIAAFQRKAARERGEEVFAPVADRLVAAGRLGQKTGGGWYDYLPGERKPQPSPAVATAIEEAARAAGSARIDLDEAQIQDAVLLPMAQEGARILAEGVALRAADVDLVEIHGYGFPRWRGGLMHWARARGMAEVEARLAQLASLGLTAPPDETLARAIAN